jgi:hypothetical protein
VIAGPEILLFAMGLPFRLWLDTGSKPRTEVLADAQVFFDEYGDQLETVARDVYGRTGRISWWVEHGFMAPFDVVEGPGAGTVVVPDERHG